MADDGIISRIEGNCKLLWSGYSEKVDYTLAVAYHRGTCPHYNFSQKPKDDCACPVANEKRTRNIKRPGLMEQLQQFAANKDTDRNPKAERGAPRVKTAGRPPGDMGGFFVLDEIVCDIGRTVDRIITEAGRDRSWAAGSAHTVLMGLHTQVAYFVDSRPDLAREADKAAAKWVAQARAALRVTVAEAMLEGTVCGNCDGALAVPWDNAGAVRCVGSPSAPPCGEVYGMDEWIKLYERGRQ